MYGESKGDLNERWWRQNNYDTPVKKRKVSKRLNNMIMEEG